MEYAQLISACRVTSAVPQSRVRVMLTNLDEYKQVEAETGVPAIWLAAINERESSSNMCTYLGNGDPLNRVTRDVPRGRGPFDTWHEGAIDALRLDHIDKTGPWTFESALATAERWNGYGYRAHGVHSAYVWACTSIYTCGMYVSDGEWSASAVDHNPGVAPLMLALYAADNTLGLPGMVEPPPAPPAPVPETQLDVRWLQQALGGGLAVDGNYGRQTRQAVREFQAKAGLTVDGIAGPETIAALRARQAPPRVSIRSAAVSDNDCAQAILDQYAGTPTWNAAAASGDLVQWAVRIINGVAVVTFRGSANVQDWLQDFKTMTEPAIDGVYPGFADGMGDAVAAIRAAISPSIPMIVTGHSLGAARATVAARLLMDARRPPVQRVTFGSPRPATEAFIDSLVSIPGRNYVNGTSIADHDFVTNVPFYYSPPMDHTRICKRPAKDDPWGPLAWHRMQYYADFTNSLDVD